MTEPSFNYPGDYTKLLYQVRLRAAQRKRRKPGFPWNMPHQPKPNTPVGFYRDERFG